MRIQTGVVFITPIFMLQSLHTCITQVQLKIQPHAVKELEAYSLLDLWKGIISCLDHKELEVRRRVRACIPTCKYYISMAKFSSYGHWMLVKSYYCGVGTSHIMNITTDAKVINDLQTANGTKVLRIVHNQDQLLPYNIIMLMAIYKSSSFYFLHYWNG